MFLALLSENWSAFKFKVHNVKIISSGVTAAPHWVVEVKGRVSVMCHIIVFLPFFQLQVLRLD